MHLLSASTEYAMRNGQTIDIVLDGDGECRGCTKTMFSASDTINGELLVRMAHEVHLDQVHIALRGMFKSQTLQSC